MPNIQRKVHFFRMSFRESVIVTKESKEEVVQYKYLDSENMVQYFEEMYNDYFENVDNGRKAKSIHTSAGDVVIEIVEHTEKYGVFKIGHQKTANTVGLRNYKTLSFSNVPMKEEEDLEMYTYCYMDYSNFVCAIISVYGAPTISALTNMFRNYFSSEYKEKVMYITADSILSTETIEMLSNKEVITNVTATIALPQEKILDQYVYLNRKEFGTLHDVKSSEITLNIVGKRNSNLFYQPNQLVKVFNQMQDIYDKNLKSFSVKAKNKDEKMETYNVLNYKFTRSISLSSEDSSKFTEKEIVKNLKHAYTSSISEIEMFIR